MPQKRKKEEKTVLASLIFHRSFWIFFLPFLNNREKRGFLVACKLLLAGEQSLPRSSFLNVLLCRACQVTCAVARLHARLEYYEWTKEMLMLSWYHCRQYWPFWCVSNSSEIDKSHTHFTSTAKGQKTTHQHYEYFGSSMFFLLNSHYHNALGHFTAKLFFVLEIHKHYHDV